MLSAYYCWRPVYDGYECLQLLEQNGGFGNNGAQPPVQIHNTHNNAGKICGFWTVLCEREVVGFCFYVFSLYEGRGIVNLCVSLLFIKVKLTDVVDILPS